MRSRAHFNWRRSYHVNPPSQTELLHTGSHGLCLGITVFSRSDQLSKGALPLARVVGLKSCFVACLVLVAHICPALTRILFLGGFHAILANDYTRSGSPGFESGAGCVLLDVGTSGNLVGETKFPPGTTVCGQVLDLGSNSVIGADSCK